VPRELRQRFSGDALQLRVATFDVGAKEGGDPRGLFEVFERRIDVVPAEALSRNADP